MLRSTSKIPLQYGHMRSSLNNFDNFVSILIFSYIYCLSPFVKNEHKIILDNERDLFDIFFHCPGICPVPAHTMRLFVRFRLFDNFNRLSVSCSDLTLRRLLTRLPNVWTPWALVLGNILLRKKPQYSPTFMREYIKQANLGVPS